jgi:hypothetical protein
MPQPPLFAPPPQGPNPLFAPPYIPGNPQAVAAATAYNTAQQAQINPVSPPAPPMPPVFGGPVGKALPFNSSLNMRNSIAQTLMRRRGFGA